MKIISGSAFLVLFGLSLYSFSASANEVDDFLGDILSSEIEQEAPQEIQDLEIAEEGQEQQAQQGQESLQEQGLNVNTAMPVIRQETIVTEELSIVENLEGNNTQEEQAVVDDVEYAEYADIAEYYNRNETEDGFFSYELSDGNSTVLQNINIISSTNSSEGKIIEVVNLATDAEGVEVQEELVAEQVEETTQVDSSAQKVETAPAPALNDRARGNRGR